MTLMSSELHTAEL